MPKNKPSEADYKKYALEAIKVAKKLPYYEQGEDALPIGKTWGDVIGMHRDSDILDVSNFEVIKEDLQKRFPEDVDVLGFNHFAVGWIDELVVRMLDKDDNVTPAGKAAIDWMLKLESYPVADEDDFSRRELEAEEGNL